MSGLEVIGGVAAIIGILDATIKVYGSARKDLKLPEAFNAVGRRLPVILDTLQTCQRHLDPIHDSLSSEVCTALELILDSCDEKARKLREILEKVIPGENDGWTKRYSKILKRLGKGNKVEELMAAITEDVRLVVDHQAVKSATPQQLDELQDTIQELLSVESSVPEGGGGEIKFSSDGGAQTNNVNSRIEQQINNNAPVNTQYNGPVTIPQQADFGFRKAASLCLGQAPRMNPQLFVGRALELAQMKEVLKPGLRTDDQAQQPAGPRQLVLGGMGGVGKTQLAITYAERHCKDYTSAFWLNATSAATVEADFQSIAQNLVGALKVKAMSGKDAASYVHQWLSDDQNTQWLLIFDNYDQPDQYAIRNYFPPAWHGSIIITSRLPDKVPGQPPQILVPSRMSEDDGLEILRRRSGRDDVYIDSDARRLVQRLGSLPLALATAGTFLHKDKNRWTFQQYLEAYEQQWDIHPRRPLQLSDYDKTLYTTWDLSHTYLKKHDPDAAQLLKLLAYFDHQAIWFDLLHAGTSVDLPPCLREVIGDHTNFESVMRVLVDHCFVELQVVESAYTVHTCVHDWTLAALNSTVDEVSYWYAFNCVTKSIGPDDWDILGHIQYASLAPHAARLTHNKLQKVGQGIPDHLLVHAGSMARLLQQQGHLGAADLIYTRALAGKEKVYGADHTLTLDTVNDLGNLYADQGKLVEAEQMYTRALAGSEKAYGADHTLTLDTVNNLGILYADQGKLVEAEQMYTRALAGMEKVYGADHTLTLETVNNLGALYADQGKLVEAEEMYTRALVRYQKVYGADHRLTLKMVNNLGILYADQGKLVEAEQMYTQVLVGYQKVYGADHTSILKTVNNLGNLYTDQGKLVEAEQMYTRALAGMEKVYGADHILTLTTVNNLGILYKNQGKLVEAERLYIWALAGFEKAYGAGHILTLNTVNNLGTLYKNQSKLVEAERMYTWALAGSEKVYGADHTLTLDTVNNLGNLYTNQGKLVEAEQMYKQALAGKEKALGLDHPRTQVVLRNLNRLHKRQSLLSSSEQQTPTAANDVDTIPESDEPSSSNPNVREESTPSSTYTTVEIPEIPETPETEPAPRPKHKKRDRWKILLPQHLRRS